MDYHLGMNKQVESDTGINIEDLHRHDIIQVPSSSIISSSSGIADEIIVKTENVILDGGHINNDKDLEMMNQDCINSDRNYVTEYVDAIDNGGASLSNNGRWTKSEHELFLRGMSLWGRDWKKVQSAVKVI